MSDNLDAVRVLSERETIRVANLSERTWDRLKAIGDVPPKTRLSPGRVGYRVSDIKMWLDARRERLTREAGRENEPAEATATQNAIASR